MNNFSIHLNTNHLREIISTTRHIEKHQSKHSKNEIQTNREKHPNQNPKTHPNSTKTKDKAITQPVTTSTNREKEANIPTIRTKNVARLAQKNLGTAPP